MQSDKRNPPDLRHNDQDTKVALLKAVAGLVPVAGSTLAELIGMVISGQRQDRLAEFCELLSARLDGLEAGLRERIVEPENIELIEEGATQAARAVSEQRRQYIASVVANGLDGDQRAKIEAKRLLNILAQIDDDQIIILASYVRRNREDDQFFKRHESILAPVRAHLGSSQDELDRDTFYKLPRAMLRQLGLLTADHGVPAKGALPEFDQATGQIKVKRLLLSPLGRLLLARIGLITSDER